MNRLHQIKVKIANTKISNTISYFENANWSHKGIPLDKYLLGLLNIETLIIGSGNTAVETTVFISLLVGEMEWQDPHRNTAAKECSCLLVVLLMDVHRGFT